MLIYIVNKMIECHIFLYINSYDIFDHIYINSLVPSVIKINIGNPGNQVNYWGGLTPPLIYLATWISSIGFLCTWEPAN